MKHYPSCGRAALFLGICSWVALPVLVVFRVSPHLIGWLALLVPALLVPTGAAGAGWVARRCWSGRIGFGLAIAMFCLDAVAIWTVQSAEMELRHDLRELQLRSGKPQSGFVN